MRREDNIVIPPDDFFGIKKSADAFWRDRGIIPMEERQHKLQSCLPRETVAKYVEIRETLEPLFARIRELPRIQRLLELKQFGRKSTPQGMVEMIPGATMHSPALHTRHEHSEFMAELVVAAGAQLHLGEEEICTLATAAWLHDSHQPAFSHACDELLVSRGVLPHEDRVKTYLDTDMGIRQIARDFYMRTDDIMEAIAERGQFGILPKIFDTLSYLVLDSDMSKQIFYPDQGARVIASMKRIDSVSGVLVVSDPEPLQEMLEFRAQMRHEIFFSEKNRRADEALRQLLRIALDKHLVTVDEIQDGVDDQLFGKLQSLTHYEPGAAMLSGRKTFEPVLSEYQPLFRLVVGCEDSELWQKSVYDYDNEAGALASLHGLSREQIEQSFVLSPIDYTEKKIRVGVEDDSGTITPVALEAKRTVPREECAKKYVVYSLKK